ncbi:MAG: hypothetical protein ACRD17_12695 [Terriglobales bacterium]
MIGRQAVMAAVAIAQANGGSAVAARRPSRQQPTVTAANHSKPPARPLGNAAVLALLRAGFAPSVVAAQVRQAPQVNFDVSPPALQALREAGATPAVLLAMLARETPRRGERRRSAPRRSAQARPRPPGPPIVYIRGRDGLAVLCWQELRRRSDLRLARSPAGADWLLQITAWRDGLRRREMLQVFDRRSQLLLWSGEATATPFRHSAIRRLTDRFLRTAVQWRKKGGAAGAKTAPPGQR